MKWNDLLMTAARNASGGGFSPTSIAGLQLWLKADTGLTLSTTGYAGSGTVTQVTTAITGVGTAFLTEVKVGDALSGTNISGNVTVITDNTHLTLDASNTGAGADYTITPTAGTSDRVTTWADQSSNARNITQATAFLKPMKKASGQNGLPTVAFDGGAVAGSSDIFTALSYTLAQPVTLFIVLKQVTWVSSAYCMDGGAADAMALIQHTSTPLLTIYGGGFLPTDVSLTLGTFGILCAQFNGTSSQLRLNAGSVTPGNAGTATTGGITLGGRQTGATRAVQEVAELIEYNTALSAGDETLVRTYLNTKWAIF